MMDQGRISMRRDVLSAAGAAAVAGADAVCAAAVAAAAAGVDFVPEDAWREPFTWNFVQ